MDFLDPDKRRSYHRRLILGYILVGIVVGLGTLIIVYAANGYGINTKTGQVVQNGLLFIDSKPGGAKIFLNGKDQNSTTSSRLFLPAANYTLKLTKDGYRSWTRTFTLNEKSIERYVYPFLFPTKPVQTSVKTFTAQPPLVTQSPDRKWLLMQNTASSDKTVTFDQLDTTTLDQTPPVFSSVSIPANLLTKYSSQSTISEVEWSTDNNNVLLLHKYSGGSEFIVFNRDKPDQSFNVNTLFGINPSQVALRDKKANQLYIYSQPDQTIQVATVDSKTVDPAIIKHALAFKAYGKNIVMYVSDLNEPKGRVGAFILDNDKTYKLNEFSTGSVYLIDAAQFQSHFYYVSGSDTSERLTIFKDPEDNINDKSVGRAVPVFAMHLPGANKMKFSDNTRFIGAEAGQRFAVYDFETKDYYQYPLSNTLAANMHWMDGHRLVGQSEGQVLVMDYDGINKVSVSPTLLTDAAYFSREYNHMLTVTKASDGSIVLQDVDMRAGSDLPKAKQ